MTITTTVASNSGFIPEIWAQEALSVLRGKIALAKIVSRDTDYDPFPQGKTLHIPYPGTLKGKKLSSGGTANIQTPAGGTTIDVTLDQCAYVDFLVNDIAATQANPKLMNRYISSAMIGVAEQIEAALFQKVISFSSTVGTYGTSLTQATLLSAKQKLSENKIPLENRHLVIPPKDITTLIDDDKIRNYVAFQNRTAMEQGELPMLDGFMIHESQLVPTGAIVTIGGGATGGTFKITVPATGTDGELTTVQSGNITYAAGLTAASIQSTLEALTGVGAGNVSVTGANGGPYTVRPIGTLAGNPLGVSASDTGLTGGTPTLATTVVSTSLAFHPEALILASRPLQDPPGQTGVVGTAMTDMESGLSIRVLYTYDIAARSVRVGFDFLFGVAVVRNEAGVLVKT